MKSDVDHNDTLLLTFNVVSSIKWMFSCTNETITSKLEDVSIDMEVNEDEIKGINVKFIHTVNNNIIIVFLSI